MSNYAVVEALGSQHKVQEGQVIRLEKIEKEPGSKVEFETVLLVKKGEDTTIGSPYVAGSKVVGEIVDHGRGKKINVIKFKRRKGYLRKQGHRQLYTDIKITEIK